MIKRRIEKLEQLQRERNRNKGIYVAFAWDNQMKITKGLEVTYEGAVDRGEGFLEQLSSYAMVIRFNIPRAPLLRGSVGSI